MNKRKKKKGFTLIELVIVLAVLAIIALIAIPNFTKVRNDSLAKADTETMNQIEKITLMAIANGDLKVPTSSNLVYSVKKAGALSGITNQDYTDMLKEVSDPQVNGRAAKGFQVTVTTASDVTVTYTP